MIANQVPTKSNWLGRVATAFVATAAAITALGHFPGWEPDVYTMIEGVRELTTPGHWRPLGQSLFEWVGISGVFVAAGWARKNG